MRWDLVQQSGEKAKIDGYVTYRVRIPVECVHCHWRHYLEVELEDFNSAAPAELQAQLQVWVASRCPAHLGPVTEINKN